MEVNQENTICFSYCHLFFLLPPILWSLVFASCPLSRRHPSPSLLAEVKDICINSR